MSCEFMRVQLLCRRADHVAGLIILLAVVLLLVTKCTPN